MKLAIGTAQFGMKYGISNVSGKVSQEKGKEIIKYAASSGIDIIDTAIAYGDSEAVLGDIGVKAFKVITKLPEVPDYIVDIEGWVINAVKDSISRLGVESLYGLLLHRPGQLLGPKSHKILPALRLLKDLGLVKNLGISVSSPIEFEALFNICDFDIVQCPFNLIDRRLVETGWLKKLKSLDVEVHSRSSFLQGLLLMKIDDIPLKFSNWGNTWKKWDDWQKENCSSALEGCLSFINSFKDIDRVVVGVDSAKQLGQIIESFKVRTFQNYPEISSYSEELISPVNWEKL